MPKLECSSYTAGELTPTSNSSYNTGRFMSEASFISLLRI